MGNCLGQDNSGGLNQGLVPSGGMLVGAPEKAVDPDDPWKDWYYNDYDQPAMVDGRLQSGRWDMSRESFAGKLEEKQRIQQSLAQKAQLDKANAALAAQRASSAALASPQQAPQQQYRGPPGAGVPGGRPSKPAPWTHTSHTGTQWSPRLAILLRTALLVLSHSLPWLVSDWRSGGKPWCGRSGGDGAAAGDGSWQRDRAKGHRLCGRRTQRGRTRPPAAHAVCN